MRDGPIALGGLALRSPILAAAGPHVDDGEKIRRAVAAGAGAVVTKTICAKPERLVSPSLGATADGALAHVQRASEVPADLWFMRELPLGSVAARAAGVPLIASIGFSAADAAALAPRAVEAGADAVELNLRSTDPDDAAAVVAHLRPRLGVPILYKVAATADVAAIARTLGPRVDAFTAVDSLERGLAIDARRAAPLLGGPSEDHAVSGPPLKPIALWAVHALRRATDRPIVGTGGVRTAIDAIDLLVAGATAVGVATAAILDGDHVYADLDAGVRAWAAAHAVPDVAALADALHAAEPPVTTGPPTLDRDACTASGRCATVCPYGAVGRDDTGRPTIEPLRCVRCGLCITTCPSDALRASSSS